MLQTHTHIYAWIDTKGSVSAHMLNGNNRGRQASHTAQVALKLARKHAR